MFVSESKKQCKRETPIFPIWRFEEMVLSASPCSLTRSSLEEMLDSLRRRDEDEANNKESPPALPSRPASKARLPPARRSLPNNFKVCNAGFNDNVETKRKETSYKTRQTSFGRKRVKMDILDSPYVPPISQFHTDTLSYFIQMKLSVWCRQPTTGQWELGSIHSTSGDQVSVSLSNGKVLNLPRSELVPANPNLLDAVDDLIKLAYLNHPSVLHNLRFRYSHDMIYSKAGPILIALNPFKDLQIYGNDYVSTYRQQLVDTPHVYGMVDAAYNQMMTNEVDQSIITSGESGSGKTETAKIAIQYLASLGSGSSGTTNVVLQTNCILETFGNAKTSVNDNSSRFGKFMEIHFSATGKICGAKIQTYLLEKSRVVQVANGERSYHVLYQLCAGSSSSLKERLNLRAAHEYKYLNQSDCITIGGIDDARNFHQLMEAFDAVRISKEDQELIFKVLAAILWLGNISFKVTDSENHIEVVGDEAVTSAALLMGCSSQDLMAALSTHKIQSDKETVVAKRLTLLQAIETKDAIAKFIYSSLFEWIVQQLNRLLEVNEKHTEKSISILDFYGFQSFQFLVSYFQKNNFEQFCINYANERLQQHFNRHLFKLELEDCESDGIDCSVLDFGDNQECLDLFEKVLYDTNDFLVKNRDTYDNSIQLLSSCNCELLKLFSKVINQPEEQGNSTFHVGALYSQKRGVGTKFKDQLFKLIHQLENTTPHFIRCIKPNTTNLPGIYDKELVLQQLRCCGVLEAVKISKAGFPTRVNHQEFSRRYGFLLSKTDIPRDPLSVSVAVLQKFNIPSEMYQVGYTKLYLRAGQIGALEDKRKQFLRGVLGIQKCFRGHQARSYFCKLRNGVTALQSFIRGDIARKKHGVLMKSSITIYSKKLEEIYGIIVLQSVIRGWLVRRDSSYINKLRNYHENENSRRNFCVKMPEVEQDLSQELLQNMPSALAELQKRAYEAEAVVEQKEEENTELREQLKQSERKRVEYEKKMKSMEEVWQKQMASLQSSLVSARKSLASENGTVQPVRHELVSPRYYDSEDASSMGSRTTSGSTPMLLSGSFSVSDAGRQANGTLTTVSNLMKEFEQQRQTFNDEVKALNEIKPGQSANTSSADELRKLKQRFEGWKKQYKVRLRETKARLSESEKSRRTWWGKLSLRA
ncbi:myosin-2-like isoform X3 [Vicia villosa]|uniref:myosin-2-like isoform X3 n=1 Tax=Vicia villosa TaxID=3911 RepID=UPI00273B6DCC|nr:myosin-2-like isoform X3 [Vicia villosa]